MEGCCTAAWSSRGGGRCGGARRSSAHGWVQCGVAARAAGSRPAQAEGGAARGQGARGAAEPCTASGTALAVAHMTRGKRRKALALEALVVADARKGRTLAACARISPRREGGEGWGKAALGQNQNGGTEVLGWGARLEREELRPRQTGARGRAWAAGKERWPCIRQRRQAGLGAMHMEMEGSTRAVPSDGSSGTSKAGASHRH